MGRQEATHRHWFPAIFTSIIWAPPRCCSLISFPFFVLVGAAGETVPHGRAFGLIWITKGPPPAHTTIHYFISGWLHRMHPLHNIQNRLSKVAGILRLGTHGNFCPLTLAAMAAARTAFHLDFVSQIVGLFVYTPTAWTGILLLCATQRSAYQRADDENNWAGKDFSGILFF